jgi:hypothetical protein
MHFASRNARIIHRFAATLLSFTPLLDLSQRPHALAAIDLHLN